MFALLALCAVLSAVGNVLSKWWADGAGLRFYMATLVVGTISTTVWALSLKDRSLTSALVVLECLSLVLALALDASLFKIKHSWHSYAGVALCAAGIGMVELGRSQVPAGGSHDQPSGEADERR